jgi:hypothetical protein
VIRKYQFPTPVNYVAGDQFERAAGRLFQLRNDVVIASWRLRDLQSTQVSNFEIIGNKINSLFMEVDMPGQNVSMTNVRENQTTGVILVDFSSGTQLEFQSWEAVGEIADNLDSTPDMAEKILLGKAFRASPDGTNKRTQIGASVSTNLLASEPIVYTEAT